MTFACRFSTAATLDILDAGLYLEKERPGYAQKFRRELNRLLDYLCENPRAGTILYKNRRKVYLRSFNYHIIYTINLRAKELQILFVKLKYANSKQTVRFYRNYFIFILCSTEFYKGSYYQL